MQAIRKVPESEIPAIGSALPNSWHNASECDWVEEDTELDGTCGFEIQHPGDPESFRTALDFAASQWPGRTLIALIEGQRGDSDVPEDGGCCVRGAVVIGLFWWEL